MPRQRRFPPYPCSAHPSGQARIKIDGKHVYLGVFDSPESRTKYHELQAQWATRQASNSAVSVENYPDSMQSRSMLTVAEAVARWTLHAQEHYEPRGREASQFRYALEPVVRLYGTRPVAEFDSLALETVQKAMASGSWMTDAERAECEKKSRPIDWCRNVTNRRTVRIQTAWKWLERNKLVPPGTHANLMTVGGLRLNDRSVRHTRRREPATWEQVQAVLPCIQTKRRHRPVAAMLEVQWFSGCRSAEVRLMRACDLDRSGEVWLYRPERHKTEHLGQDRIVALGPECQRVLAPWLVRARGDACLFTTRKDGNKPFSCFAYCQAVRRAARKAGVPLQPYQTRHGFKVRATRAMGLDAARAQLGQRSIGTTNGYAQQQDMETATDVARKLG